MVAFPRKGGTVLQILGIFLVVGSTPLEGQTVHERMRQEREARERVQERLQRLQEVRLREAGEAHQLLREELRRLQEVRLRKAGEAHERVREELRRLQDVQVREEMREALERARLEAREPRPRAGSSARPSRALGLSLTEMNAGLSAYFFVDRGVLVLDVRRGSALGLRPGDVILAIDGRDVETREDLWRVLRSYGPQERVTFSVVRQGEETRVEGKVG